MANKAVVGEKVGMTQVWDEQNRVVPVTVLRVAPLRVVQVKTPERDGYAALQVTFGDQDPRKLNKPERGHFDKAGVDAGRSVVELRIDDVTGYEVGQQIGVDVLAAGELVDVTAVSKGKGFAGTMKRHNFSGQKASHGTHRVHRKPGSVGACATPTQAVPHFSQTGCPRPLVFAPGECSSAHRPETTGQAVVCLGSYRPPPVA